MSNKSWKTPFNVLLISILFIAVFAVISFQLSKQVKNFNDKLNLTTDIKFQLQIVQNALLYNESNAKSYIISPSPQLEILLKEVPDLIRAEIKKLETFLIKEPVDQLGIDSLSFYTDKWIEYTSNVLKTRKERGFNAALTFINASPERYYITKTRSLINYWKEKEDLEQQNDLTARKNTLTNFNLVLLSIFILVTLLGVVYVLQLLKNADQKNKEIDTAKYLQTILDNISEPVITTDADFKIQTWNKAAAKVYALDPVQSKETDIATAVRSQFAEQERAHVRNEMRKNGFWKGEVMHLNAEGQEIIIQSLTSALVNKDGKLTGYVSANRDITEEKLAKDLLSKFAHELATQVKGKTNQITNIFERVSDAFVALDTNWRYTYLNKKAEQIFHKQDGYLIGKHIWTEFPESVGLPFYNACEKALKDQQYIYLEEYYPPYDKWYESHIYPSPTGISIYFRDITEKVKANESITKNEVRYRSLIEQASDGILVIDLQGTIIDVNPALCNMFGYSKEETLQKNIISFLEPENIKSHPFGFLLLHDDRSHITERVGVHKNGTLIAIELNTKLIGEGKALSIIRDVTERNKVQQEILKERDLSNSIINSLPGLFYIVNENGRVIRWNNDDEANYGYTVEEISQMNCLDFFEEKDKEFIQQLIITAFINGKSSAEANLITKAGDKILFYLTATAIEFEAEKCLIGTGIDISDMRKTELSLKKLEERDRSLFESLDAAVVVHAADTSIIFNNQKASALLGLSNDQLKGKMAIDQAWKFLTEDDIILPVDQYPVNQILATKQPIKNFIVGINRPVSDDVVWVIINGVPVFNESGELIEIVVSFIDITASRKATEQIKEKSVQLQILSDNLPDTMMYQVVKETDGKMKFTYLSKSVQLLSGKSAEEVMQDPTILYNLILEEDQSIMEEAENVSMKEMKPFDVVVRARNFSGAVRWLHIRSMPRKMANGKIIWDGIHTDITMLKEAEIAVLKSKKHYQALTEISPVGIFHTDINGSTTYVNPKWCMITGLSFEQALGNGWLNAVYEEDKEALINNWNKPFKNQGPSFSEYRFVRPDGSIAWVLGGATPERNQENQIVGYVGTITDITERNKMEEEKNWFSNTLQKSLDEIYLFNAENFQFEYANDGALSNLGYTTEEILKLTPLDIKPEMTLEKVKKLVIPLLNKEKDKLVFETIHKRKDSSVYPVEVHLQMIEQGDRKIYLTITRDISERKNQQQKIEKEFRENEALINSTSDLLWSVDADYKLISANDTFIRGVKHNGGFLIGRGDNVLSRDFFPDEYLQYWKNIYDKGLSGEKQLNEIFTPKLQGTDLDWFELRADPIDVSDKVTGIACSMRNITERKKITEFLKASEEKYRTLVENAPEALVVVDVELQRFISVSESAESLFKITKDKLLELGPAGVSPEYQPDGRLSSEAAMEKIMKAVEGGKPDFEWMHCDSEGRLIPCEVRLVRLPSENKILVRGSITDITERKKAEEKIRKANERFELIGKATNDAIWEWNLETNEIWGNEAHQELYGLTIKDPVPGDDEWKYRLHPEDKERVVNTVAEAIASDGNSFVNEYRLYTENKKWINIYGSTYIERNKEGKAIRLLGNMTDITESKKKEQHLKLLESVIVNTNDAVLITEAEPFDAPGPKIVYVNEAFCKMTGYTESEVIGKTPRILQGPKTDRNELNRLKEAMKKWEPCEVTTINYKKNGQEFWINFSISPVANERGWFTHWISIDKDVTERKIEEKQLKDSEERLRLSLKAANQGLYDVNIQTGEAIVNDQYAFMLGYDPATFVETNSFWLERVHPDDLAMTSKAYLDYVQGKSGEYRIEFRQKTKNNNWKWILSLGKIVENDAQGKPLRMLGTHTDITERKMAEEALQNAEKRLRFLLTSTPAIIYSRKATYPFSATFISENIKERTGYQSDDFINDPKFWSDHIHPEEKQNVLKNISQLFEKGHHLHEYRFRIKNGNYIWIQDEVILINNEEGEPEEVVGYWINIDERKSAEEALAESENRLRTIYNTEPECIKMLNSKGELLEMNPAGLAMIEAGSLEQVKGQSILNIIDKEYRNKFSRLTKNVFDNKPGNLKFSITGMKGTKRWMETHAVPMKNADGEITALLGVTMDITEKRQAELELKVNEEKYRTLVEQAVDAIALYDNLGKILDVNTGAVDLLGYSKDELMKMYLPDILTKEEIKIKPVRYDLLEKGDSTIKERVMRKKDGTFVQTEVRSQQLPDGRFLSVIRDLSQRIKAEKDLDESYKAIRKLTSHIQNIREEERTNIAREIHDELGQQLTVMKMDVSWINKKLVTDDAIIKEKVKGMLTMLDETVKSVRRISSELRPSLLDDLGLIAAMEWQLFEIKKRSEIKINFAAPENEIKLPDFIKTGLFRIFQESLTNVIRHSGAIELKVILVQKDHHLTLSIADNGKGFDLGKISKRTLGILGMKERASMIGGTYEIKSTPGKGTEVLVIIPING